MKKLLYQRRSNHLVQKIGLKMKLSVLIFFSTLLSIHANDSYSQETRISLHLADVSVERLLEEIESSTEFRFVYRLKDVDLDRRVSIQVDKETIEKILSRIFTGTKTEYEIIDRQVFLLERRKRAREKPVQLLSPNLGFKSMTPIPADTLRGTVVDESGFPLIGVNIQVKGTNRGAASDLEGNFEMLDVADNAVLVVSYIGYQTQEIEVGEQNFLAISLQIDAETLDELVVVGYGTVKKSDLTGSVERINSETFQNQSMTQLGEMLTGTVAGLNSNQGNTASGESTLEIRGTTSLNASSEPLIVLDGVIFNGNISDISPSDIKTIDILKDASSSAVYGSRAAAGVIIVTTKKGSIGKPIINFSTDLSSSEVSNRSVRPLSPTKYTTFRRDLLIRLNPNQPKYYYHNPNNLPSNISTEEWYSLNNNPNADLTTEWLNRLLFFPSEVESYKADSPINWYDKVIQKGLRQNYDLSISGGTETISYYWSLGYTDNEGIVVGDYFSTLRTRLNVNAKITDFLEMGVNAQFANRDNSAVISSVEQMLISSPFGSEFESNGSIKWFPNDYVGASNPLIDYLLQDKNSKVNSIFSAIYVNVSLPFNIRYKLSYQPRFEFSNDYNFWSSQTPKGANSQGLGDRSDGKIYEWMVDNLISWNQNFGIHNFDFTYLYNLEQFQSWQSNQSGEGFIPNENLSYNALQFATNLAVSNIDNYSTGDAMMGRLNYTLNNKYLFTFSIRRDGYSAFGQGNPRATFPAAAFAWKLSEENIFADVNFVDHLKIRLSWGVNGNREIGRYAALARLGRNLYSNGSQILVGVLNNSLANPDLAWERTEALNFGIDFGFKKGQLGGSIDLYNMSTTDLLMERVLPRITGFSNVTTNLGELQNRGLEISLNSTNISNPKFQWKTDLSFSLNRNKILSLFGDYEEVKINGETIRREVSDITNGWFIGQSIDAIWDYDIEGVWQSNEADQASEYGLSPGDYKARDVNGDGVYSALDDKQFIGWRTPRYRVGIRNSFNFLRNFNASIFLRSELGHKGEDEAFKHIGSALYDRRSMRDVPYWTEDNPSNVFGSITAAAAPYGGGYNIYFSKSFLRVQDVSLGYSVPESIFMKLRLQSLRVYLSARNLVTIDQWKNWDPESGNSPMPRILTFGLDISL